MVLGLPGGAVQVRGEVWVEAVGVVAEWGVTALEPALVATVFALTVVPGCPIK